jgi:hypothetical protein
VWSRSAEYLLAQGQRRTEHATVGAADATFPCIRRSTSFPRCGNQGRHPIRPTLNIDESVIDRNWRRGRWLLDSVREGSRHAAQSYYTVPQTARTLSPNLLSPNLCGRDRSGRSARAGLFGRAVGAGRLSPRPRPPSPPVSHRRPQRGTARSWRYRGMPEQHLDGAQTVAAAVGAGSEPVPQLVHRPAGRQRGGHQLADLVGGEVPRRGRWGTTSPRRAYQAHGPGRAVCLSCR